jgi:acyl-coenzyme A synthetase/AMP-(fatty) acid ligase
MSMDYARVCQGWNPWSFIPPSYNLGAALTAGQVRQGRGDKPALLWENARGRAGYFTYRQLDALSNRFASALRRLGVRFGDRVFLRLPNLPEFYVAALAVAKLGGVFIPSSTQFRDREVSYRLNDSAAVAAVTTPRLLDAIENVRGECPALEHVIVVAEPGETVGGDVLDFARLVDEGSEAFSAAATRPDDLAFIAYTSGTTGDPKGVVHLQRYPLAYESLVRYWHDYRPDDVVACPSELGWLLPVACTFLYALEHGLTVVLHDAEGGRFDARRWFDLFQKYRISNFTAPPTTYRMLMAEANEARGLDLSCWRHGVSAGEPLAADTVAAIRKHFGVGVLDGIGMTECMVYCFNMVGASLKPGSCGRPGPGTVIDLLDDDLQPVPAGADGVLCVRRDSHPGMMREYWRKPERTGEVFRGDWYCTGDVLSRDPEGYFWFKGRNDDVMKASGYRISPFEVESCLVSHPAVLEAAAVESPDPVRGMVVKAFLVLRPGRAPSAELTAEIQAFAKQQMAGYKYPRKIEFVAALPKTTSGKIKRKELRERELKTGMPDEPRRGS